MEIFASSMASCLEIHVDSTHNYLRRKTVTDIDFRRHSPLMSLRRARDVAGWGLKRVSSAISQIAMSLRQKYYNGLRRHQSYL